MLRPKMNLKEFAYKAFLGDTVSIAYSNSRTLNEIYISVKPLCFMIKYFLLMCLLYYFASSTVVSVVFGLLQFNVVYRVF